MLSELNMVVSLYNWNDMHFFIYCTFAASMRRLRFSGSAVWFLLDLLQYTGVLGGVG